MKEEKLLVCEESFLAFYPWSLQDGNNLKRLEILKHFVQSHCSIETLTNFEKEIHSIILEFIVLWARNSLVIGQ